MASLASTPKLIYGTAWKAERTAALVEQAVLAGFRAIDTACQPKHYNEKGVGDALESLSKKGINRSQLFVQTKFTPIGGHDSWLPYDPAAPISVQVQQSFETTKRNLRLDFVDSLVLHSPYQSYSDTLEAWQAMEGICKTGGALQLGISNIYDLEALKRLFVDSKVKPKVVQNRFYSDTGYDKELRAWCASNDIRYQSFWTLTANPHVLKHPSVRRLAAELGKTPNQLLFRYLLQNGVDPLTGTTSEAHMNEDLAILEFEVNDKVAEVLEYAMGIRPVKI